jgi:hypothetical protein
MLALALFETAWQNPTTTTVPLIQMVLVSAGFLSTAIYFIERYKINRKTDLQSRIVESLAGSPDTILLGIPSMRSLCGPWL